MATSLTQFNCAAAAASLPANQRAKLIDNGWNIIILPNPADGREGLRCYASVTAPKLGPQTIPIETRVTRSDMPLLRANPCFELALIHRSGPRNCATNKERQRGREGGSGAPTMKKKSGAGSSDDTKSISPSRHALPISRMNGMFSSPPSLSLSSRDV